MTNALPVHRMGLPVGARASAPAAYVRALDLSVERLDQDYARTADEGRYQRYDYAAPVFSFACRLVYDDARSRQVEQAIASELVVTLDTVKKHVGHVLGKLGAANRTEAVARARELELIP